VVGQQNADIADTLQLRDIAMATIFGLSVYLVTLAVCLVLAMSRVSMSRHVMSHDCVLTVSLSGIHVAKCLFCAETLARLGLAESRPLGPSPFTCLP